MRTLDVHGIDTNGPVNARTSARTRRRAGKGTHLMGERAAAAEGSDDAETQRPLRKDRPNGTGLPLHPFLFAAASVFALYASNLRELSFADIAPTLAVTLGLALALLVLFALLFRSLTGKAAILASLVLVTALSYGDLVATASRLGLGSLSHTSAMPGTLVVLALSGLAIAWLPVRLAPVNLVLNFIAGALFLAPAWQVAKHEWQAAGQSILSAEAFDTRPPPIEVALPLASSDAVREAPDIYYVVFDRYGSRATLQEQYGFDNAALDAFLRDSGFYVASDSRANYLKTAHSLASTFHMGFLDFLAEHPRSKLGDWHLIYDMLENHRVGRFLKSIGYEFVQVGSWWGPTQSNPDADETYSFGFGEFENRFLHNTIAVPLLNRLAPHSHTARRLQWDNGQCQRVPLQVEAIKTAGPREAPVFVFAHILVPHDPFVFDRNGRCLSRDQAAQRSERDGYVEQVRYANRLIEDFVTELLQREGPKPVIIIQADEGPFPARYRRGNLSWHEATREELRAKTGILNAFYFPDRDYGALDQDITSVNTFIVLFNKLFGTRLERLPDRVWAFPDIFSIYDFYEITDLVRPGEPSPALH